MRRSRRKNRRWGEQRDGGVVIWKPVGMTSRAAVDRAQWRLQCGGLGHTGTLDPLACGLLVVLGGEGRKFQQPFTQHPKEYVARIVLGMTSGSGDGEGPVASTVPRSSLPDRAHLERTLEGFVGEYVHVPPKLSAVRIDGRRSYEWARDGKEVSPDARVAQLTEVELLEWRAPLLWVRVACSSGTYIRSFARDLGERLGCGAFLVGLKRTKVGGWCEADAVSVQTLTRDAWCDLESLLVHEPRVDVTPNEATRLGTGQKLPAASHMPHPEPDRTAGISSDTWVAWADGKVRGIVEVKGSLLQARRWLSTAKQDS